MWLLLPGSRRFLNCTLTPVGNYSTIAYYKPYFNNLLKMKLTYALPETKLF